MTEAADQSVEAATRAQATSVGSFAVPMLERTVDDIARAYERSAPLPLFRRTLGVRTRYWSCWKAASTEPDHAVVRGSGQRVCAAGLDVR